MREIRRIAIAGGGMAGSSVACALRAAGFLGEIVVVDARDAPDLARTWCWWDVPGVAFRDAASHVWSAWRLSDGTRDVVRRSKRHPYVCLTGERFFAAASAIVRASNVTVARGERVVAIVERAHDATLRCASGRTFVADLVVDARGAAPPAPGTLVQRFAGVVVRVASDAFEPGIATLMAFRRDSHHVAHFTYVLPFAADRALVEDTVFTTGPPNDAARRADALAYVEETLGARVLAVEREERGAIAMCVEPPQRGRRIVRVGSGGGASRASSGYAFVRTQRHAAAIARAVVAGEAMPTPGDARYRALDRAFLRLLRTRAVDAPDFFMRLFVRADPDALARFMSDASSAIDDARVLSALLFEREPRTDGFVRARIVERGASWEPTGASRPACEA